LTKHTFYKKYMKKTINYITLIACCMVGASTAATYTVTNYVDPAFVSLQTNAGTATSGVVAIGFYTTEPTSAANFLSGFTQLGALQFGTAFGGLLDGYISGDIIAAINTGNAAIGKTVYLVGGNAGTLAESTQAFVWKATNNSAGNTFTVDAPVGGPDSVQLLSTTGSIVNSIGSASEGSIKMAVVSVVPEPSAALLAAFGALGLLRRRRN
jgi:MYXO-CTERM domain-containing protein